MNPRVLKTAASTLVLGMTMVSCKPAADNYRPSTASAKATRSDKAALNSYQDAQKALQKGDLAKALAAMEQAVALSPQDAGYRKGLAELYVKSGRFASAETSYGDAVALNPGDSNAAFYLVIAQIAQGKNEQALTQLVALDASIAPADLGLAYALAGDARRAVAVLEPAARASDATAKVRQNLALAYAFAGDWKRARVTASQDVSPKDLAKRLQQWAELASPTAGSTRVAILLGVTPSEDPGQPARLALAPTAPAAVYSEPAVEQASSAEPTVSDPAAPAAPVVVAQTVAAAASDPAPASVGATSPAPAAEIAPLPAPIEVAQAPVAVASPPAVEVPPEPTAAVETDPAASQLRYAVAARQLVDLGEATPRKIVPTPIPAYIPAKPVRHTSFASGYGRYVVQLGAFSSPSQVERAWSQAVRRYSFAVGQEPLSTTVQIPGKGTFHRLAVAGFGSQAAAARLCHSIRARSGSCFVRTIAGDAPVQWASRYSRKA